MAAQEPWPSLDDKEFIEFSQQFPSRLCKRMTMVLRKFEKGFIACKFSALAYLLIGILWLDRSKSKEEKIELMKQFNVLWMGSFKNKQLENIFMKNKREDPSKTISRFEDIEFEDDIALFGIVENDGYNAGEIYHYFLILKLPTGYFILSSYGSDAISIYQYKTRITPESFTSFVKSLNKDKRPGQSKKINTIINKVDVPRIRGFMRAHFLNPKFKLQQRKPTEYIKETYPEGTLEKDYLKNTPKDIKDEIDRYTKPVSHIIQFQSILPAIQEELIDKMTKVKAVEGEAAVEEGEVAAAAEGEAGEAAEVEGEAAAEVEVAAEGEAAAEVEEGEVEEGEVEGEAATIKEAVEAVEIEEAEEIKRKELESALEKEKGGTMKNRKNKTRKGKRTHYVRSRRYSHSLSLSLLKK